MRGLIVAVFLCVAIPVAAQPSTPCNPNSGTWAITTNSVAFYVCSSDGLSWLTVGGGGSGLPTGAVIAILAGTCPEGYAEAAELAGKTLIGTTAAAKNVGTTGGSDTITDVLNHTHAVNVTDNGHTHLTQRYPTATGGSSGFTIDTSMSGTLADNTLPTKTAATGITAATVNPAGSVASIDNRSAFVRVIFCRKT